MPIQQLANLPGVQVTLQDGGLRASPAPLPPVTDSMILIGTALDGPAMVPVRATSTKDATDIFGTYLQADGKSPNGTTLIPALKQALAAGARNVHLMRINGKYAEKPLSVTFVQGTDYTLTLNAAPTPDTLARTGTSRIPDGATVEVYKDGTPVETVTLTGTNSVNLTTDVSSGTIEIRMPVGRLRGRFQGASYNSVKYRITTSLDIWSREDTASATATQSFPLANYATLTLLASAVNATSVDHDAVLEITNWDLARLPAGLLTQVASPTALSGGDDQLNLSLGSYTDTSDSVRSLLKRAYDTIAQAYPASMIVPKLDGITYDPGSPSGQDDALVLAETCHQMAVLSQFELTPIGFLAVEPIKGIADASAVSTRVNALKAANLSFTTSDGTDIGRYLSIVFGEPVFNDEAMGLYVDTGEAAYAGLVSSLEANRAPLNRPLPGVVGLRYSVNLQQADELTGARFVVLNERSTTGPYVVDSPTAAKPDSDYRRLTTMRIAQLVSNRVRQIALPFLGEPMDVPTFTTLNANLRKMVDELRGGGFVHDMSFAVNTDPSNPLVLAISISMVPVFEVKRVSISIALRRPQPA